MLAFVTWWISSLFRPRRHPQTSCVSCLHRQCPKHCSGSGGRQHLPLSTVVALGRPQQVLKRNWKGGEEVNGDDVEHECDMFLVQRYEIVCLLHSSKHIYEWAHATPKYTYAQTNIYIYILYIDCKVIFWRKYIQLQYIYICIQLCFVHTWHDIKQTELHSIT